MTALFELSIMQLINALKAEQTLLTKGVAFAAEKNIKFEEFLEARLAPDMWTLSQQITISCMHAATYVNKITGATVNNVVPGPATLDVCKKYLEETLQTLYNVKSETVDTKEAVLIGAYFGPENIVQMKALDYVQGYLLPNVFFHQTILYAILRSKGVPLAKGDYISSFIRLP